MTERPSTSQIITALNQAGQALAGEHVVSGDGLFTGLLPHLPPPVRDKVESLIDRRAAFHAELLRASDARREVWHEHSQRKYQVEQSQRLRRFTELSEAETEAWKENTKNLGFKAASDEYNRLLNAKIESYRKLDAQHAEMLAGLQRRLDKAVEAHTRAVERYEGLACIVHAETWLRRIIARGGTVQHVKPAPVTLKTPGTYQDAVAAIRAKIEAADEQMRAVEAAPMTRDEFRRSAHAEIDELANAGKLAVDLHARHARPLSLRQALSQRLIRTGLPAEGDAQAMTHFSLGGDPAPTLVALLRPQIIAAVDAAIDAADDFGSMDDATRAKKLTQHAEAKLALEREEESAIVAAEGIGFHIGRRHSTDPRAFLEISEQ